MKVTTPNQLALEALKGVLRVANRATVEFDAVREAITALESSEAQEPNQYGVFDVEGNCVIAFRDHDFAQQHINSMIEECPDFYHEFKPFSVKPLYLAPPPAVSRDDVIEECAKARTN